MNMNITIDASSLAAVNEAWKQAPQMVIEELTAATYQAEMLLEREVKELTPVGVGGAGGLRGNIHSSAPEVLSDTVIGMVGSSLSYAEPVELGTKPHPVSEAGVMAIEDWVRHKLGIGDKEARSVAYLVARKIRREGTPAYGMFHRALAYNRDQLRAIYEAAALRIIQRLAGVA